jgi:hypothetical protein
MGSDACGRHRVVRWALALALVAGCSDDALTELVVAVDSDLTVPGELQSVHLRVVGPFGDEAVDTWVDLSEAGAPGLPLTLSLTPGSDTLAPVRIEATGTVPGGTLQRWIETGFVAGERRLVSLLLLRACIGVTCEDHETCVAGGMCVDATVPPDALPPWTGDPGRVDAGVPPDAAADAAMDAGADAGMDAGDGADADVATDAAVDAAGGCTSDEDCLPELVGDCVDGCEPCGSPGVPVDSCTASCLRMVTSHGCVEGTCVPSQQEELRDCVCDGAECENDRWCMRAVCNDRAACVDTMDLCGGMDCECVGSGGSAFCEETNGGGGNGPPGFECIQIE